MVDVAQDKHSGAAKKIAIIGSTGGNLYLQGGRLAKDLLDSVEKEAEKWGFIIGTILYLCADQSMDAIHSDSPVRLITRGIGSSGSIFGELAKINRSIRRGSEEIGDAIKNGEIDALISISADPFAANRSLFEAAASLRIPIVASGASSVAWMRELGCNVIYASGTTGTSSEFRALNYMTALVRYWGGNVTQQAWQKIRTIIKRPSFSFETWTLPYFLLIVILKGLLFSGVAVIADIYSALLSISPLIACLAVSLSLFSVPHFGMMAVITTGVMASFFKAGFIGGIITGYITALVFDTILHMVAGRRMPGSAQGVLIYSVTVVITVFLLALVAGSLNDVTASLAMLPEWVRAKNLYWIAFVVGAAFWPAMESGLYHKVVLPFILLEISVKGMSVVGAFDVLCLVVMAVGANIAALILGRDYKRGLVSLVENIAYGTNVEYVYAMSAGNRIIRYGLYLLCGIAGIFILQFGLNGVGYLPLFILPFLVENGQSLGIAMAMVAFGSAIYFVLCSVLAKKSGLRP
jgi:hypothetical protein